MFHSEKKAAALGWNLLWNQKLRIQELEQSGDASAVAELEGVKAAFAVRGMALTTTYNYLVAANRNCLEENTELKLQKMLTSANQSSATLITKRASTSTT